VAGRQRPYHALESGSWFKLIGGASSQNIPALGNLALIYTLAGADCIDVSADPAVIARVAEAIESGLRMLGLSQADAPFLMVSLSDGDDPHFRKAHFPSLLCPPDCSRPCLRICPVDAITRAGVLAERCYGCGRCEPVCPHGLIALTPWSHRVEDIGALLAPCAIDAVEIHPHAGNREGFARLWRGLAPLIPRLKLVAVSFPDEPGMREHLEAIAALLLDSALGEAVRAHLVWQIDGLPMSGDLARGTARAAVRFAREVQAWGLPGHLQLAGGTNDASVALAREAGLAISGIGYGSYARRLVQAEVEGGSLAGSPPQLEQAVRLARTLVRQLKPYLPQEGAPWLTTPLP